MTWTPSPYNGSIINYAQLYAELETTITSILGYKPTSSDMASFPYDIYRFIIKSLRTLDQDSSVGGTKLLERYLDGKNEIFYLLWKNAEKLKTIYDPTTAPVRYLKPLRELVGFGDDIGDIAAACNEQELRRLVIGATLFWMNRWKPKGLEYAIRLATGNRYKVRDYFDFRYVIGEQMITEELQNEDPYLLTLDTLKTFQSDTDGLVLPNIPLILVDYNPFHFYQSGPFMFTKEHIGAYIYIYDDSGSPSCNGIYEILDVNLNSKYCTVNKPFPRSTGNLNFVIVWEHNEYLTEIRVADEIYGNDGGVNTTVPNQFTTTSSYNFTINDIGKYLRIHGSQYGQDGWWEIIGIVGGGVSVNLKNAQFLYNETGLTYGLGDYAVNRVLLEKLVEQQRFSSERINVVYVDFMDMFNSKADTGQWQDLGLDPYNLTVENGKATFSSQNTAFFASGILTNRNRSSEWTNYSWKSKISMTELGTFYLLFNYTDIDNCSYVEIDYISGGVGTAVIRLYDTVSGSPTLVTSASFPALELDSFWTYTVETYYDIALTQEVVELKIDNVPFISSSFSTTNTKGNIGYFVADTVEIEIDETELWQYPLTINRVGPNP